MDVVSPHSRRSCCFTKNYTRYIKGAGSVLAPLLGAAASPPETKSLATLAPLAPRFFSPREIANLHGFPSAFTFPPGLSRKKQYELLGNSLSVQVVARLLTWLFAPSDTAGEHAAPARDTTTAQLPPLSSSRCEDSGVVCLTR